jgi:hypothetical protein
MSIIAYDYILSPDRHVMSIDWAVLGCREHKLPEYQPQGALADSTQCGPFNLAVDVYFNGASNRVLSYNPDNLPADPIRGPLLIRDLISFRTEHELQPTRHPAGSYTFRAFVFAIDPATNLSVDIAQFTTAGSLDGLTTPSCAVRIPVHDTNNGTVPMGIEPLTLEVEYRPYSSSGAFTMCVLVTSWTLTLVSVYVSLVAMTKGRVDFTAIILHAFTALAILGLWEGWLGKQSFGAYLGSLGFYLQSTTVTVCSMVLLRVAAKPTQASWQPEKS